MKRLRMPRLLAIALLALSLSGCVSSLAAGALADVLSGPSNLGSDDDPELVRDAAPFGLKTMESVLEAKPEHVGLLTSLASGFTQYAFAFVQQGADADELEMHYDAAAAGRRRARKLYLRARDYGLRGLELSSPGLTQKALALHDLPDALATLEKKDVPLLYWTAAAWALAISNGKEDMQLVAELPGPEALMQRALALDETWGDGAIHEFFVTFEASKPGGSEAVAKQHLDRALELSKGRHLGVLVSWAEGPLVQSQNREAFETTLKKVLDADVEASKPDRLSNTIAQRRATLLLQHTDDLFN